MQGGYIDNMMIAELGFIPQIYKKKMELFEQMKGKGNKAGMIGLIKQDTGFDYVQASQFYNLMQNGKINEADYNTIAGSKIGPEYASRIAASKGSAEMIKTGIAELGKTPTDAINYGVTSIMGMNPEEFGTGITLNSRGGSIRSAATIKDLEKTIEGLLSQKDSLYSARTGELRPGKEDELEKITAELKTLNILLQKLRNEGLEVSK